MNRLAFTFGTLYEPQIVTALLGTEPTSFLATLHGYAVYKGTGNDLSDEMKADIGKKRNLAHFIYLFAKKSESGTIEGKVHELSPDQEKIFDKWERYPMWYSKEDVTVTDEQGNQHNAFVYVINQDGEKMATFERVQGNIETYVESAKRVREKMNYRPTNI